MPPKVSKSSSLKTLRVKLSETITDFEDIRKFISIIGETTTCSQVKVRLERLDDLWERFSDTIIEVKTHEDFVAEDFNFSKERQDVSDLYYEAKAVLMDKLKELQEPFVDSTFSGNIDEWMSFRDLYTSLIHWKTDLPDVEKFHYLKGCLQGEPKSLVDSLQITRANYQVAWDLLVKRYNNSKLLKKKQIPALFRLPQLTKESPSELHSLVEDFQKAVQILDQAVQSADYKDLLLIHLLTSRLDPVTRRSWEEHSASEEQETISQLMDFLQKRVTVLESLPVKSADTKFAQQHSSKFRLPFVKTSYGSFQTSGSNCPMCSGGHFLYECAEFKKLNATERDSVLLKQELCRNCLRAGHQSRECKSKFSCRNCKGRHHTLVCSRDGKGNIASTSCSNYRNHGNSVNSASIESDESVNVTSVSASGVERPSTVLLATAVVWLEDEYGRKVPARALLDSGSECNFATERLSQLIKASRKKVSVTVQGIGQSNAQVKQQIRAKLRSRVSDFSLTTDFLVFPKVTANLPTQSVDISGWRMLQEITLADPAFFTCRSVDLVLGIESFFSFFKSGQEISLGNNLPTLIESVFGWVICGGQSLSSKSDQITCNVSVSETIEDMVSRFWLSEEIDVGPSFSPEEARCEEIFKKDVQRSEDDRYIVSLPRNESVIQRLGESKRIAMDRLKGTERRLAWNPVLYEEYHKFMNEYIQLGHMRKVEERDAKKRCFLPHHPVLKEASTTTKVRVVFDASCKTSSGVSLNEALLLGPTIQQDLRSIILRSRTRQIMIVSDVEKMFRQVYVRQEDRPLQCILWRGSPEEEINVYEMNTVTYGTKPAPFLATRALKQLAIDERENYSKAAQVLCNDVYMDDVITGADTTEEAIILRQELDSIMKAGGFLLRKWASNSPEVLKGVSQQNLAIKVSDEILLDPDPSVTTLGLVWRPKSDVLKLKFQIPRLELTEQLTKRKILSVIASLFDPLGLVGAAITTAKIFLQLLWTYEDSNENQRFKVINVPSSWIQHGILKWPKLSNEKIEKLRVSGTPYFGSTRSIPAIVSRRYRNFDSAEAAADAMTNTEVSDLDNKKATLKALKTKDRKLKPGKNYNALFSELKNETATVSSEQESSFQSGFESSNAQQCNITPDTIDNNSSELMVIPCEIPEILTSFDGDIIIEDASGIQYQNSAPQQTEGANESSTIPQNGVIYLDVPPAAYEPSDQATSLPDTIDAKLVQIENNLKAFIKMTIDECFKENFCKFISIMEIQSKQTNSKQDTAIPVDTEPVEFHKRIMDEKQLLDFNASLANENRRKEYVSVNILLN
ncbi:uncharacterized protein LOC129753177 [Uranotaenia lowii]|uniref:uncharacterized protein LOC129753177 n=1 Tax=Uranotaenia lowii TaxID=190385 RepID=UPI00247A4577|nr:uncharacterized protein LOC129753177 [Uranotaenia lowii]